ncbi:MAG TPA: hypothetical protein VI816_02705 [Candidatus Bathyarchaeia archaeon]|nr:hypothetical protein [Candidatus Bathyarchaeia archaeon]
MDKKDKAGRAPTDKRSDAYSPAGTEDRTHADNRGERFGPEHPEYQRSRVRK